MTLRKFAFISAEGYADTAAATDSLELGALAMSGNIDMTDTGKIVNLLPGTVAKDALSYAQTGANLQGLSITTNPLTMGGQKITGGAAGTATNDVLVYGQSGAFLSGLDAMSQKITNVADPTNPQDVCSKAYADAGRLGLDVKSSVRVIATSNITLSGTQSIDSVSVIAGDRVLVAGQTSALENGIYLCAAGAWTRTTDADSSADLSPGSFTFVEEGTVYQDTGWVMSSNSPFTLDTSACNWTQFSAAGQIVAGNGLVRTGNVLDVGDGPGILVSADKIEIELGSNPALEFDAGGDAGKLLWKPDTTRGLAKDASGAYIDLATDPGFQFTGGKLDAKLYASGGLQKDANGLGIKLDGTTNQLSASGLSVKGLPALFEIATVATSANVTSANLGTLTAGSTSDAGTLHKHSDVISTVAVSEAVAVGDPGYWSATNDQMGKGDCTLDAKSRIKGVFKTAQATPGSNAQFVASGVVPSALTGATAGAPYYLAAGGGVTATAPTGSGNRVIEVGIAKNATDLFVAVIDYGKRAA